MIVDSSVLIAILTGEPDAEELNDLLSGAHRPILSVVNYLEAAIVLDRHRSPGQGEKLDRYLAAGTIGLVDVTESQVRIARSAYRDFGKGSRHRAGLNFGDCFAYALAKATGEPLLFQGEDFAKTDVVPAI